MVTAAFSHSPHAPHLWDYFAVPIFANSTTRPIAQGLRARHRAGHAGGVQHTLAAHPAIKNRALTGLFDDGQKLHGG